ncbi:hypothetical protein B5C34_03390 [Pacificimonas flava]|uniref:S-adenosylmethionine tRNA ribosyltransferase n=2 Tax=Pacificimonas TaxID=1960290 RepID=A0A219B8F7_9SPHN|nr:MULTISPECIES: DUF3253 domain-containing protein [Pacificimonas]MBZ6377737.1 DUF3253 domain-containing protein [Pacificimonas aurantium]OWV34617.1 hypothetical protein B5C34_03390 [Pacificimonas flava]
MPSTAEIEDRLLGLARDRGQDKSFCPSEAARALVSAAPPGGNGDWRVLMPDIRTEASRLVAAGELRCTRAGAEVDPLSPGGPIRLSLPLG